MVVMMPMPAVPVAAMPVVSVPAMAMAVMNLLNLAGAFGGHAARGLADGHDRSRLRGTGCECQR